MDAAIGVPVPASAHTVNSLGSRLRDARLRSGLSLREVSRRLGVSPSFISQMENGKSQPSVATLYAVAQLLEVSIDALFAAAPAPGGQEPGSTSRTGITVVGPADRPRLGLDSGVIWERLAVDGDRTLDFMEITYPVGARSSDDGRMLQHAGIEYGYLITGVLEIAHGDERHLMRAGQSLSLDATVPHLLTNVGDVPARGIWAIHHCGPVE